MKGLTLTIREQSRIVVLNGVMEGKVSVAEAARLMGVSERHAWRLLRAYRKEGVAGVAHGNRGRRPSTTTCPEIQEKVIELATGVYSGFNHSHLTEMLADREGIHLSRSTVRRVLLAGGIGSPRRRRAPKRYLRRERYPQKGMLLQIDGSRHNWLEGRGATSDSHRLRGRRHRDSPLRSVPSAGGRPRYTMLREIIDRHGIPTALYSDRHSIFPPPGNLRVWKSNSGEGVTQFARALELGIRLILAHTLQAKGRVERAWDTFQDRLVSEMRLAGTATIANRMLLDFLPRYNRRFGRTGSAWLGLSPTGPGRLP